MKGCLLTVAVLIVLFLGILYLSQGKLIYFPRRYSSHDAALAKVEMVTYDSEGGKQRLFLANGKGDVVPNRIWWVFGGNGSVALDWVDLVGAANGEIDQVFVLFDYPGYGFNEGKPSPKSIADSVSKAIDAVAEKYGISGNQLMSRSRAVGHSLGCAVALETAHNFELSRVIAISPFTTMKAMAERQMGWLGGAFLSHQYDNEKTMDGILESDFPVDIRIFHGDADSIIPFSMGRALATRGENSGKVTFTKVSKAGHNDITMRIAPMLIQIFEEPDQASQ